MDTTTPEVSATSIDYKSALGLLDQLAGENTYTCYIPSLKKEVMFKAVNAGQQKELLKSIVDSPFYRSKFITTTYKILKDNLVATDVNFDDFDILDKQVALLKTRIDCFNSKYDLSETNSIDLTNVYRTVKNIETPKPETVKESDKIVVHVKPPTVAVEFKLEKELHANSDVMDVNNPNALRAALGEIFIGEISKYVTGVEINGQLIDLTGLSFKERINVLEKFPNTLIQHIIKYIDSVKAKVDLVTTVEFKQPASEVTTKETFSIDSSFFAIK